MWSDYPNLCDRRKLCRQLREGRTIEEIARENGCSRAVVRAALRNHRLRRPLLHMPQEMKRKLRL